jgi:hypothetical protein
LGGNFAVSLEEGGLELGDAVVQLLGRREDEPFALHAREIAVRADEGAASTPACDG